MFPLPKYKMTAYKLYEFQRKIVVSNAFFGFETIIFGCLPEVGLEHKDRKSVLYDLKVLHVNVRSCNKYKIHSG